MQRRRCPNCHVSLPIGSGVHFDEHNNVLCVKCGKPVIAATSLAELEIATNRPKLTPTTTTWPNYGLNPQPRPSIPRAAHQVPPWNENMVDDYSQDQTPPCGARAFGNRFPDACM